MSNKLIVAVVVAGTVLATTPFYLSGFFAHKALAEQMRVITASQPDLVMIKNAASELGLYRSNYEYDMVYDLTNPQMAPLKASIAQDTVVIRVVNRISHGFLNVSVDTTIAGQGKQLFDDFIKKHQVEFEHQNQVIMTMKTIGDFSLSGRYQMDTNVYIQGFSFNSSNELGEKITFSSTPTTASFSINEQAIKFDYQFEQFNAKMPDSQIDINKIAVVGALNFSSQQIPQATPFNQQNMLITLDSVTMSGAGKSVEMVSQLNWTLDANIDDKRGQMNNHLSITKIGNPQIPASQVENLLVNFNADMGANAARSYYKAIQSLPMNPQDPTMALALFGHILSEDININLEQVKAQTFVGPIDITGQVNIAAVMPAQFSANPAVAMQGLKYALNGEVPQDLLMMSGQLPPEFIDNLLQQQMIEVKDEQVIFNLSGEAGHINLNGKPLM